MAPEQQLQKKLVAGALATPFVVILLVAAITEFLWLPKAQPIPFPHDKHAGMREIDCQYCHRGVTEGDHATVPSVQDCKSCHDNLSEVITVNGQEKAMSLYESRPETVGVLKQYIDERKSIEWFKVYDLPEHVKFTHKVHTAVFDCAECHGDVAKESEITLQQRPTMGWCVSCHRANNMSVDCSVCHR